MGAAACAWEKLIIGLAGDSAYVLSFRKACVRTEPGWPASEGHGALWTTTRPSCLAMLGGGCMSRVSLGTWQALFLVWSALEP